MSATNSCIHIVLSKLTSSSHYDRSALCFDANVSVYKQEEEAVYIDSYKVNNIVISIIAFRHQR